ncbi:MAG: response regulator [Bryobacterales bacterium]|nr:response regulator [Bryobacterales bacterium]
MERIDLDHWKAREVARLLTLVENDRRYYQEILTSLPIPVAVVSRELHVAMVNRAFRLAFQLKHEELGDKRLDDLIAAPEVRERILSAFETNSPEPGMRFTMTGADKGKKVCRLTVIPLWDAYQDRPQEAIVVIEEPDTVVSPAARLLDALGAAAWQSDPRTGEVAFANGAASSFLAETSSQWTDRVHPADASRVAWVYEAAIESGAEAMVEYRSAKRENRWLADRIHPVLEEGNVVGLEVITVDETEARRRRTQAVQHAEMEATMRLAQQVAHEFNNLWMIVTGYAEVMAERAGGDEEVSSGLEAIQKAAERGILSTAQLLQFGRPATSYPRPVDLRETLRGFGTEMELRGAAAPIGALLDPVRFEPCLQALVEFVRARLAEHAQGYIQTEERTVVADLADGLPRGQFAALRLGPIASPTPKLLQQWCHPFYSEAEKAASIGLAPCYAQIRQMGGWVTLETLSCGDAEFVVFFPLARLPEPVRPPAAVAAPVEAPADTASARLETILVVDDEESIRNLVARVLSRSGYGVLVAESGEEGVRTAEEYEGAIGLVLTDVMLPGMRGPEMAARVRKTRTGVRTLYISGYMDDPDLVSGILPAGEGFLQKPFTLQSLLQTVRGVLDEPLSRKN